MAQQTKRAPRSRTANRRPQPTNGAGPKGSNSNNDRTAAGRLADVAKTAKGPALAAGAGLAGLAGGFALASRTRGTRILGVRVPGGRTAQSFSRNLAEATKNVASFGEGMGSLAAEVRRVSEGIAEAGETRRSPIEVVLQGLTKRR